MFNIQSYVNDKINSLQNTSENTIVVIKGIDINLIDKTIFVDSEELINNKLGYFIKLIQNNRKLITFDEYLVLKSFILTQFNKIVILENNLYIKLYPLNITISDSVLKSLTDHYDEDKEGTEYEIGNITEMTNIYANVKCINNKYYVAYNYLVLDEKESIVKLFDKSAKDIDKAEIELSNSCFLLRDEDDYVNMLDACFSKKLDVIYIIEKNSEVSKDVLAEKLQVLSTVVGNFTRIKIGLLKDTYESYKENEEYKRILKEYWGYDEFRNIKVYNLNKLENKEKSVDTISQSQIIDNIVQESEKCIQGKDYRDIFVTAPTGAGKSLMFQIPAMYLAHKYNLFTLVISPLIGLMNDQVENLHNHNYKYARTINSDISPIVKQEIINDIVDCKCHVLYLSPESLLSKSDLDQIIGSRKLGLLVVDEAHIVTTWGKQFRPDYWYLGDHLNKIKKSQLSKKGMGFVIATFTATAIYGGIENMYEETIQSLKMVDPITFLGYIKRDDINIKIDKSNVIKNKTEYELNKFDQLINKIDEAMIENKKVLVYFPTVALINRFYDYCDIKNISRYVARYNGQMLPYEKEENFYSFLNKEKPIMLATKAFGMGIDIDDIEIVVHFAPTGNVCDYVQEIGRVARRQDLNGEAYYNYMTNDFKHINRLHGLSIIKNYQLIEVIKKVYELYQENIKNNSGRVITKKRNEMLVDAESFSYVFENPFFSEDDGINKVKTAMLLIQKDFERMFSFAPFNVRPIPLFEIGFFSIEPEIQISLTKQFGRVIDEVDLKKHVCSVNLKRIWEPRFSNKFSFPRFKYLLYTRGEELEFSEKCFFKPALCIDISFSNDYITTYSDIMGALKGIINGLVREEKFISTEELKDRLMQKYSVNTYKARSIIDMILSAMAVYQRDYSKSTQARIYTPRELQSNSVKYKFLNGTAGFFRWIDKGYEDICKYSNETNTIYLIDDQGNKGFKETLLILGILETLDLLVFKSLGGKNSQIYIYVNQTKTMKEIIEKPSKYKNRLLELVSERHEISVKMLTYLFENDFTSDEIWNLIEEYFLGIIPEKVMKPSSKNSYLKMN